MSDTVKRPWFQKRIIKGRYRGMTWQEKFWLFVDKRGPDECWEWKGKLYRNGYGCFGISKKAKLAHRASWELTHGSIPEGMNVCHNCPNGDNCRCVNPSHLFLGSQADNIADMDKKGRRVALRGTNSPRAKLKPEQVIEIRRLFNIVGMTAPEIAERFGISATNVHSIADFRSWKHVGGPRAEAEIAAKRKPKLTEQKVKEIKAKLERGRTHQSIADEFGVKRETITRIANGKNWRHVL